MTLNYGIFDSADPLSPDRTYTAALLSRIVSKYLDNGIITGDLNEMTVTVSDPPGMSIIVATGTAMVQGRFCENDAALTMTISTAHSTYARIDRVVVRLSAVSGRTIDIVVIAGTPAASPVAPALTQTSGIWEIPLAQIAVGAGVTSILTANITDQRVFPDMTNLFRAAVEMQGDLDVGGDVSVAGDMHVTGAATYGGSVAFAGSAAFSGGVIANLTGNVTGKINSKYKISTVSDGLSLGVIMPAVSTSAAESTSPLVTTIIDGLQAILAAKTAINPAHSIINNLGCTFPANITVSYGTNNTTAGITVTATDINNAVVGTWSVGYDYGEGGAASGSVICGIPSTTNKVVASVGAQYKCVKSCSMSAQYATFS